MPPVTSVSWNAVQGFIQKLNAKEGGTKYRLPTEAEWEYACRSGSKTEYSFGENKRLLAEYAYYGKWWGGPSPVGQLKPNDWGLYDMHGNVLEWVQDRYDAAYYQRSPACDPQGPDEGASRVVRGGSWYFGARSCRAASRDNNASDYRDSDLGFRLARSFALGS